METVPPPADHRDGDDDARGDGRHGRDRDRCGRRDRECATGSIGSSWLSGMTRRREVSRQRKRS